MRNLENILNKTGYGNIILNIFKLVESGEIEYSSIKDYMESKVSNFPFLIPSHMIESAIINLLNIIAPNYEYFSKIRKIVTTEPKYDFAFLFLNHYNVLWSVEQQELFENMLYNSCYDIQEDEEKFSKRIYELFMKDEFSEEIMGFLDWVFKEGEQLNNILKELV